MEQQRFILLGSKTKEFVYATANTCSSLNFFSSFFFLRNIYQNSPKFTTKHTKWEANKKPRKFNANNLWSITLDALNKRIFIYLWLNIKSSVQWKTDFQCIVVMLSFSFWGELNRPILNFSVEFSIFHAGFSGHINVRFSTISNKYVQFINAIQHGHFEWLQQAAAQLNVQCSMFTQLRNIIQCLKIQNEKLEQQQWM